MQTKTVFLFYPDHKHTAKTDIVCLTQALSRQQRFPILQNGFQSAYLTFVSGQDDCH